MDCGQGGMMSGGLVSRLLSDRERFQEVESVGEEPRARSQRLLCGKEDSGERQLALAAADDTRGGIDPNQHRRGHRTGKCEGARSISLDRHKIKLGARVSSHSRQRSSPIKSERFRVADRSDYSGSPDALRIAHKGDHLRQITAQSGRLAVNPTLATVLLTPGTFCCS